MPGTVSNGDAAVDRAAINLPDGRSVDRQAGALIEQLSNNNLNDDLPGEA